MSELGRCDDRAPARGWSWPTCRAGESAGPQPYGAPHCGSGAVNTMRTRTRRRGPLIDDVAESISGPAASCTATRTATPSPCALNLALSGSADRGSGAAGHVWAAPTAPTDPATAAAGLRRPGRARSLRASVFDAPDPPPRASTPSGSRRSAAPITRSTSTTRWAAIGDSADPTWCS